MKSLNTRKITIYILWTILGLAALILLLFLVVYFWPHNIKSLQNGNITKLTYEKSLEQVRKHLAADSKDTSLRKECRPILRTHDTKPARAVMMIHGVSECPRQFSDLAETFFQAGYNVYVPRVPEHGYKDNQRYSTVSTAQLSDFMHSSADITGGLAKEVGVIGLSGGANLATWMVERTGVFSRALLLSPFYEPAERHAAKWKIPLMKTLYGNNILADNPTDPLSTRALAKYVIVKHNYHPEHKAKNLKHLAVITSEGDDDIDLNLAHEIPRAIKAANKITYQETRLSKDLGVAHDVVGPKAPGVAQNKPQLHNLYLSFYENRPPATEL